MASDRGFSALLILGAAIMIALGNLLGYTFLQIRAEDGFSQQMQFIQSIDENIFVLAQNPVYLIHLIRYLVVYPFLLADRLVGATGPLLLLFIVLAPLLHIFPRSTKRWLDLILMSSRVSIVFLPLAVSGRTVLVAAGMGYLLAGILRTPFSGWKMVAGCLFGILSSASVLVTIAVLLCVGNRKGRSHGFYLAKAVAIFCMVAALSPSLVEKTVGFLTGSAGYTSLNEDITFAMPDDDAEAGPSAKPSAADEAEARPPEATTTLGKVTDAVTRLLSRSTIHASYALGNVPRLILYLLFVVATLMHFLICFIRRQWHPLTVTLACVLVGSMFEGLGTWPLLFPLLWFYTGYVPRQQPLNV